MTGFLVPPFRSRRLWRKRRNDITVFSVKVTTVPFKELSSAFAFPSRRFSLRWDPDQFAFILRYLFLSWFVIFVLYSFRARHDRYTRIFFQVFSSRLKEFKPTRYLPAIKNRGWWKTTNIAKHTLASPPIRRLAHFFPSVQRRPLKAWLDSLNKITSKNIARRKETADPIVCGVWPFFTAHRASCVYLNFPWLRAHIEYLFWLTLFWQDVYKIQ